MAGAAGHSRLGAHRGKHRATLTAREALRIARLMLEVGMVTAAEVAEREMALAEAEHINATIKLSQK